MSRNAGKSFSRVSTGRISCVLYRSARYSCRIFELISRYRKTRKATNVRLSQPSGNNVWRCSIGTPLATTDRACFVSDAVFVNNSWNQVCDLPLSAVSARSATDVVPPSSIFPTADGKVATLIFGAMSEQWCRARFQLDLPCHSISISRSSLTSIWPAVRFMVKWIDLKTNNGGIASKQKYQHPNKSIEVTHPNDRIREHSDSETLYIAQAPYTAAVGDQYTCNADVVFNKHTLRCHILWMF